MISADVTVRIEGSVFCLPRTEYTPHDGLSGKTDEHCCQNGKHDDQHGDKMLPPRDYLVYLDIRRDSVHRVAVQHGIKHSVRGFAHCLRHGRRVFPAVESFAEYGIQPEVVAAKWWLSADFAADAENAPSAVSLREPRLGSSSFARAVALGHQPSAQTST